MTDDPWRKAWRTARARQESDAPRHAELRDAVAAVRARNLTDDADVHAALTVELQRRDIAVEPDQLDLMVRMAQTSSTGALVVAGREVFGRIRETVGVLRSLADPRWTQTPNGIPDIGEWRDDQFEVAAIVNWTDAERNVIERLFADLRDDGSDEEPVRQVSCWLSLDADDVRVHVGEQTVGTVDVPSARPVIEQHGNRRQQVGAFAELHGTSADDATLTVYLPDRP